MTAPVVRLVPLSGVCAAPSGMSHWCRRRDLNPHALTSTSPSSWRVCLFRHFDVGFHVIALYGVDVLGVTEIQFGISLTNAAMDDVGTTPPTSLLDSVTRGSVYSGRAHQLVATIASICK